MAWNNDGAHIKKRFRKVAEDLLHLEINTIVRPRMMTARKIPAVAHALIDIANLYSRRMTRSRPTGYGLQPYEDAGPAEASGAASATDREQSLWNPRALQSLPRPSVCSRTFRVLHCTAKKALEDSAESESSLTDADQGILTRIRQSSVEIAAILDRLEQQDEQAKQLSPGLGKSRRALNEHARQAKSIEVRLTESEWLRVRKIWEVGVEEVVMQTVIQLDGDVVTRVQKGFTDAQLMKAHLDGVGVATRSWQFLVETVAKFSTALIRLIAGFFG